MLGGGSDKLKNAINSVDLSETATAEKPVANADNLALKLRKENDVAISFYNSDGDCEGPVSDTDYFLDAKLKISCQVDGVLKSGEDFWAVENVLPSVAPKGEATKLGGIYTIKSDISTGKYPCKIEIVCGYMDGETSNYESVKSYSTFIEVTA